MFRRIGLLLLAAMAAGAQSGKLEGTYQGTLDTGSVKLRLGLHVVRSGAGAYKSTLDSIDQSAMGIPVQQTTVTGNKLRLEMPNMGGATYEGTLSEDGAQITGTFTQGAPLPLVFNRVEKIEAPNRPQNPKPPFPYESEEVTYTSGAVRLAGTLTIPKGVSPFPAALLITGSGPQDRDESLMGHKPFWVIADFLTRRGVAVLRVDDRGMGRSTGNSMRSTLEDFVTDVLAGVTFLKGRREIDPKRIGVIGHSEGGIVGTRSGCEIERHRFRSDAGGNRRRWSHAAIRAGRGDFARRRSDRRDDRGESRIADHAIRCFSFGARRKESRSESVGVLGRPQGRDARGETQASRDRRRQHEVADRAVQSAGDAVVHVSRSRRVAAQA
jgi:pimeloyl-ACP methyl ester carboxylesterase